VTDFSFWCQPFGYRLSATIWK